MSVITVSSSYGSGGSVVAARVAATLGWELHNRAIPVEVAARLSIPIESALGKDEATYTRIGRLLARFSVQITLESAGNIPPEVYVDEKAFQEHSEAVIRRLAEKSDCIIVGRAAAIVLAGVENVLNVRFDGDRERRSAQAAEALGIPIDEARSHLAETDRARRLYVKHFYERDWADTRLYHLVVDSALLSIETCVEIVLAAAGGRFASMAPRARIGH